MVPAIYLLTFLGTVVLLVYLLMRNTRILTSVVMLSILVSVNAMGRFLLSVSTGLEMAKLANLFLYTGTCFAPLFYIQLMASYSKTPLSRPLMTGLWIYASVVFFLAQSYDFSSLYYRDISLVVGADFSWLNWSYGPAHFLYPLMLLFYCLMVVYILISALRRHREIPFPTIMLFVCLAFLIISAYVLERFYALRFSFISINYLIGLILMVKKIEQINMFDLPVNISRSIEALGENAYLEFDNDYRCTGYNRRMRDLFPEIDFTCQIGKIPRVNDTELYRRVILWMYTRKDGSVGQLQKDDRYFEMQVRNIAYRNKPCVGYLLELVDRTAEHRWLASVESYNEQLRRDVAAQTAHISHMKDQMVVSMATMVESRDDSTGEHIKRTYEVMRTFSVHLLDHCQELGLTPEFLEMVTRAAPMHDLGKITIQDSVLKKQGRFEGNDYEIMKRHPTEGARIVHNILSGVEDPVFVTIAENVAHYHHERWDGAGYPDGLKGTQIPVEARLMALPDVCDALLSKRCYKEAMTMDQVFGILEQGLGTQFDPVLGRLFLQCRPRIEAMYQAWYQEDRDKRALTLSPVQK